jgi:magnesium chelatase family protein
MKNYEFLGELALSGELRGVSGALPAALACASQHRSLIIANPSAEEAALSSDVRVLSAANLLQVCAHLHDREHLFQAHPAEVQASSTTNDIQDVKGQAQAKRALEIAASGGHNLLFFGPPGTGKTMLASRLAGILPSLNEADMLEVAAIYSVSTQAHPPSWRRGTRPFRAPHHTASAIALVGGGSTPKPGEISLAHNGVLFLDELPEFSRAVLEVLREPLESGEVRISRARTQATFPARFQLIAAMNPCPCGYFGNNDDRCRCTPDQVRRYRDRISGPMLDRIDMHVPVRALPQGELHKTQQGESSSIIRQRVEAARNRQMARQGKANNLLSVPELELYCVLEEKDKHLLEQAITKMGLSTRAYHRVLKVARTLADMQGKDYPDTENISEALSYRSLDRQ